MPLRKTRKLTTRLSSEELAKIRRAARLEAQRRRAIVDESTLFRELAMAGVDQILATADRAA